MTKVAGVDLSLALSRAQFIQRVREAYYRDEEELRPRRHYPTRVPLHVLAVTSEIYPLIKTGGLADVTGALPKALSTYGIETHTLVPGYPSILALARLHPPLMEFDDLLGEKATLRHL